MCRRGLQRWRVGVYRCRRVRHDLCLSVSGRQGSRDVYCRRMVVDDHPRSVADPVLSPRYDDVVRDRAVPPTVQKPTAFLRRHRFRYCRQNRTTSATSLYRRHHELHLLYNRNTSASVRGYGNAMGRRPNAVVGEFFHRGQKLDDNSNRYQHTCKKCGQHVREGKLLGRLR